MEVMSQLFYFKKNTDDVFFTLKDRLQGRC